tara:strand:- start:396 stop:2897 length:2502 start_codon:yes stop_codon:yes gene_type:complete
MYILSLYNPMNFLKQTKLTKQEWTQMEKPLTNIQESNILKMIESGYEDEKACYKPYICLNQFLNIQPDFDAFIFDTLLLEKLIKLNKKNALSLDSFLQSNKKRKLKVSKADQIRIQNSSKLFEKNNKYDNTIIEFILLQEIKTMSKVIQKSKVYQTEKKYLLSLYNVYLIWNEYREELNKVFDNALEEIMATFLKHLNVEFLLKHVSKCIEHNPCLKYKTFYLYTHQKEIISIFKTQSTVPKFIMYCAPTSSGKTLSPLALSTHYKVLFVCASKHIGLSLAKSAYHLNKKVGFAFGCQDVDNIRLNYNAIHSYKENHYKKKIPDHSDGTNVDIMICDLVSFEYAMLYMKAFHKVENSILFWDEPTIGLDVDTHKLHEKIKYIWDINVIPNVVFSCATLPKEDKIQGMINSFETKFPRAMSQYIHSYDQITNLMMYDDCGNVIMPHTYFEDYKIMYDFLVYQGKKYYKFYNCHECAKFLLFYNTHISTDFLRKQFQDNISNVSLFTIKDTYIRCLFDIKEDTWGVIRNKYLSLYPLNTVPDESIGCDLTTKHAHSLTNGPTLYISNQVQNICKYLLHIAKIDPKILQGIQGKINENKQISVSLGKKKKDYEDKIAKFQDNDKIMEQMRFPPDVMELHREIEQLESSIRQLHIDAIFQPNSRSHYEKWNREKCIDYDNSDVYTCHVDDASIKEVMYLYTVHEIYKILLLMGVGVFSDEIIPRMQDNNHIDESSISEENNSYLEIMKQLAQEKSLYLIIANSDYIYGTNYQFSHCYLGKDMKHMSQEKIIQCIGRIGRQERNKHFSFRFRSKEQIDVLYKIPEESMEAINMNKLFQ